MVEKIIVAHRARRVGVRAKYELSIWSTLAHGVARQDCVEALSTISSSTQKTGGSIDWPRTQHPTAAHCAQIARNNRGFKFPACSVASFYDSRITSGS